MLDITWKYLLFFIDIVWLPCLGCCNVEAKFLRRFPFFCPLPQSYFPVPVFLVSEWCSLSWCRLDWPLAWLCVICIAYWLSQWYDDILYKLLVCDPSLMFIFSFLICSVYCGSFRNHLWCPWHCCSWLVLVHILPRKWGSCLLCVLIFYDLFFSACFIFHCHFNCVPSSL